MGLIGRLLRSNDGVNLRLCGSFEVPKLSPIQLKCGMSEVLSASGALAVGIVMFKLRRVPMNIIVT